MRKILITLIVASIVQSIVLIGALLGQEVDDNEVITVENTVKAPSYRDDTTAIKIVLADLLTLSQSEAPFVRYLIAPPGATADWIHVSNYIINAAVSQSRVSQKGFILPGYHAIRYDLRELAPDAEQLLRLIELWDNLSIIDPYYHLNQVTADQLLILGIQSEFPNENVAIIAPHIEQIVAQITSEVNFSPSLAYRFDFFADQVFSAENQYYAFLQLTTPTEQQTDVQVILEAMGIDYGTVKNLFSERRIAIFCSGITSRARRVDTFIGNGGLRGWLTQDIAEDSVLANQHPVYSLSSFFPDAKEGIFERQNGFHAYYLFNKNNNLVNTAPDNVARDGTVPFPFPSRLTPGISCARCHGSDGGLKPVRTDVATLHSRGFTVFDDVAGSSQQEVIDILESLYSGQKFKIYLDRGRIDHEFAALELIGNANIPAEVSPFGLISTELASIWTRRNYTYIDAQQAYLEITGRDPGSENAIEELAAILGQYNPEDPGVAALLSGIPLRRVDFDRIYTSMALRYSLYNKQQNKDNDNELVSTAGN